MTVYHSYMILCVIVPMAIGSRDQQQITSTIGGSARDCRMACINRLICKAFTFQRQSTLCQLYADKLEKYSSGTRVPGIMYLDRHHIPEIDPYINCNDSCTINNKCREGCLESECPSLADGDNLRIIGNLHRKGSKVKLSCDNFFQRTTLSKCTEDGDWSPPLSCKTYSFTYMGRNTYGTIISEAVDIGIHSMESDYLVACLAVCNKTRGCAGVNFNPIDKNCTFTNAITNHWLEISHWSFYSKTLPVSYHKSNNSRYLFTYSQGVDLCKSLGTSIATLSDAILSYKLGMSICSCAWVKEGYSVISIQYDCGGMRKGLQKCWFALEFDLFCKNKNFRSP